MLTQTDINWLKSEFLPALAEEVKNKLKDQLNRLDIKLDKLVGGIEDKRKTQELHSGQHRELNNRLDKIDKHVGIDSQTP